MKTIKLASGELAMVDDEDYDGLAKFKWQCSGGYAKRSYPVPNRKYYSAVMMMHRQIMDAPKGMDVHHVDGNGLNNQRANLRVVTRSQNLSNRGKFKNNRAGWKGVAKYGDRWRMSINAVYDTPEAAARAYDKCARVLHGENAGTNFDE